MPKSRYLKDLENEDFFPDQHQLPIVDQLEDLRHELVKKAETSIL